MDVIALHVYVDIQPCCYGMITVAWSVATIITTSLHCTMHALVNYFNVASNGCHSAALPPPVIIATYLHVSGLGSYVYV